MALCLRITSTIDKWKVPSCSFSMPRLWAPQPCATLRTPDPLRLGEFFLKDESILTFSGSGMTVQTLSKVLNPKLFHHLCATVREKGEGDPNGKALYILFTSSD